MFDILFVRTFLIVGSMLIISAITALVNKSFETALEMWLSIILSIGILVALMFYANIFPTNLILVALFSGLMGWQIGPAVSGLGHRYKFKKHLKENDIIIGRGREITKEQQEEFGESFDGDKYQSEWNATVFQAFFATAIAVFATGGLVFLTNIDFSFLNGFLIISLIILVLMGILNIFIFRSTMFAFISSYFGAIIFTLYLLFDFNRLESMAGDESWATAIDISVNLYLDIINLFLDLLTIIAEINS